MSYNTPDDSFTAMTKSCFLLLPTLACAVVFTGCTSMYGPQRDVEMRRQTAINSMRTDLQRLRARVDGLAATQEELYRRMDALRAAMDRSRTEQEQTLSELSRTLDGAAAARTQMKKDIIDSLAERINTVLRTQQPSPAARTQQGYEHVVESGQTISEIASAYNVTVQAIVQANGLRDPNQIRAGQTLFIPE